MATIQFQGRVISGSETDHQQVSGESTREPLPVGEGTVHRSATTEKRYRGGDFHKNGCGRAWTQSFFSTIDKPRANCSCFGSRARTARRCNLLGHKPAANAADRRFPCSYT